MIPTPEPLPRSPIGRRSLLATAATLIAAPAAAMMLMPAQASAAGSAAAPAEGAPGPMRIVANGLRFPEGPVAMSDGSVLCVEIARGTLSRIGTDGAVAVVAELGGGPNGAAIGPDGACYVVNNGGLEFITRDNRLIPVGVPKSFVSGSVQRVDLRTGQFKTLYTHVAGRPLAGPNDLVFDSFGGFWFTDSGKVYPRSRDQGGLYWARPDGSEIREVTYPLLTPNGVALSPDRKTLYVALTVSRQIVSFQIVGPGMLAQSGGKPAMKLVASLAGDLILDSMCVEADGTLVVAAVFAGKLLRISPAGAVIGEVSFPDPGISNAAFGGPDLRTLYVTLSQTGRIAALRWPEPGLKLLYR